MPHIVVLFCNDDEPPESRLPFLKILLIFVSVLRTFRRLRILIQSCPTSAEKLHPSFPTPTIHDKQNYPFHCFFTKKNISSKEVLFISHQLNAIL